MFSGAAVLTMLDVGQPPRQLGGIEIEINADDAPVDHPHAVRPGVHIHLRPLPGGVRAGPAASVRAMMTMSRLTFFAAATLAAMSRAGPGSCRSGVRISWEGSGPQDGRHLRLRPPKVRTMCMTFSTSP
jgi:hypothetical protein